METKEKPNEKLSEFLVGLASNPDRLVEFMKDPFPALLAAELTPNEIQVVLSRNGEALQVLIGIKNGTQAGGGGKPKKDGDGGKKAPRTARKGTKRKAPARKKRA
jgi:hypothetical protein